MKLPIKRFATSALALLLTLSMLLSVAAEDIEFSGIPGGGGLQNNADGTPKDDVYSVKAVGSSYQHLVGYRFSVVTASGQVKSNTHAKNIFLDESVAGYECYATALKASVIRPKTVIRQGYKASYKTYTNATKEIRGLLDTDIGNFDLPLAPDGSAGGETIEAWCKYNDGKRLDAFLKAAGVVGKDGLAILDSTDRILVEPIFELTLGGRLYALTLTEIAVQEYRLYEEEYNDEFGRTYTEINGNRKYYSEADYEMYTDGIKNSRILESILRVTNNTYPNFLKEDGEGIPEGSGASEFWYSATGGYKTTVVPYLGEGYPIISCIDLIEHGFGVAVVWKNDTIEEIRVKLQYHPNGGLPSRGANNKGYDVATTGLLTKNGALIETIIPKGEKGTPEDWTPMDLIWDALGEESGKYPLNTALMWNTRADGNGKTFTPGVSYSYDEYLPYAKDGIVVLYAQWKKEGSGGTVTPPAEGPDKIYLRYHTNGGTVSNSNLTEENGYVKQLFGSSYLFYETTVKKDGSGAPKNNYGSWGLAKEGYILNENLMWNTKKDGNLNDVLVPGTEYSYSDLVELDTDGDGVVILYAMWDKEGTEPDPEKPKPESITVVYSPNGGSVGNEYAINGGVIYKSGKRVETVFQKNGQKARLCDWNDFGLTRSGYKLWTHKMWNSNAEGGGQSFSFSMPHSYDDLVELDTDGDGVVILYASWGELEPEEPEPEKEYKYLYVKLHINGGKMENSVYRLASNGSGIITHRGNDYVERLTLGYWRDGSWYSSYSSCYLPTSKDLMFVTKETDIRSRTTFVGWNTSQNGTGKSFKDGEGVSSWELESYAEGDSVTLYAQWYTEPDEHAPIVIKVNCFVDDVPSPFLTDGAVSVSVYDGTGAVSKVINALSTVDSIGIEGTVGFSYVVSALVPNAYGGFNDIVCYPIEEASLSSPFCVESEGLYEFNVYYYTLSYKGNPPNGKGKVTSVPSTQYLLKGIEGSVSSVSPVLSNHTFLHWTTDSTGEGTVYYPRDVITLYKPLVLYAQWINIPSDSYATLEVYTYVDNEEISITDLGLGVRVEQVVVVDGEECVIPRSLHNIAKGVYLAPLMSFGSYEWTYRVITTDENGVDWYLTADGSYTTDVTPLDPPTSYPIHYIYYYTITYLPNAEGDVGNMPEKQYALKGIEERLSTLTPTREDEYGFVNWNTQGDGEGTAYAQGAMVTLTAPLILHAQWKMMTCELVFEAIVQGATTKQFVDDIPGAIWVETEEGSYPIGKNGTVTVTLPKGTKYRLRAIYETGGTVYPYTAKGNYEDTEFTLTKPFTHHGIYYYAINYYYGSTLLETPYRHYKLHGIDVKVSTDKPSIDFGTSLSRFLNVWDQPAVSMRYMPGAVYNLDQKGDLYAVTGVKVAYNVNGGTVGEGNYGVREDGLITRGGEIFFILLESDPPFTPIHYPYTFSLIPPQSNYEFVSWNGDSEGEGEVFVPGSVYGPVDFYSCDRTPDGEYAILYADWNPLINTVHFEATPEGYGTVELDGKPVSAVSGIPRGSEMYFENGQVVIEPIVSTPITVSYEDGSEEKREGGKFVFRAVPADPTSQYSYKHIGWEGVAPEIDRDITVIASFDREGMGNDIAIVGNPINGNPVLDSQFALSANIINNSDIDITPNMGIDAVVVITKNGSSEPVKTYRVENICVPKRGSDNATLSSVFIKKEGSHLEYILYDNSNLVFTEASVGSVSGTGIYRFYWYLDFSHAVGFTDADSSNNESAKNAFRVKSAVSESNPSRPVYNTDIPSSFKGKEAGESDVNTFSWSYHEYNPSAPLKFVKRTGEDGFKILLVATPENEGGLKKEERVVGLPDFTTRAGYGFSLHRSYSGLEAGDLNPSASAVFASKDSFGTLCALMYYPEFDYSTEAGKFSKLLVSAPNPKGDYRVYALSLPEYPDYQTNDINDKYAHYIPMWYPDGEYKTVSKYQGVWCPLGELTATVVQGEGRVVNGLTGKVNAEDSQEEMERMRMWTNKYTIQGSMYDDIYITH